MAWENASIHLETLWGPWQGTLGNQILPRISMTIEEALSEDEKCVPGQIP